MEITKKLLRQDRKRDGQANVQLSMRSLSNSPTSNFLCAVQWTFKYTECNIFWRYVDLNGYVDQPKYCVTFNLVVKCGFV